jgi:ribosomal protein S18 acetylase RimI-like enzyme
MTDALSFRPATASDAPEVADLVNSAYRGDSSRAGWTTEADLVVGARITVPELEALVSAEGSLLLLCHQGGALAGCVHLKRLEEGAAYLGLLTVRPGLQGGGLGKAFLAEAEATVRRAWGARRMTMTVITVRAELIAYYERRGYRRSGILRPFPADAGESRPTVAGLMLEVLEKDLTEAP